MAKHSSDQHINTTAKLVAVTGALATTTVPVLQNVAQTSASTEPVTKHEQVQTTATTPPQFHADGTVVSVGKNVTGDVVRVSSESPTSAVVEVSPAPVLKAQVQSSTDTVGAAITDKGIVQDTNKITFDRTPQVPTSEIVTPVEEVSPSPAPAPAPVAPVTPTTPVNPTPAPSGGGSTAGSLNSKINSIAASYLGSPYAWYGNSPTTGWSCVGYTSYVYNQAGVALPMLYPDQQAAWILAHGGKVVSNPQPGDFVYQADGGTGLKHAGIYAGDGMMYSALNPSQGTIKHTVSWGKGTVYYRM